MRSYPTKRSHGRIIFLPFETLNQWQRIRVIKEAKRQYKDCKKLNNSNNKQIAYWQKIMDESTDFNTQTVARLKIRAIKKYSGYELWLEDDLFSQYEFYRLRHNRIILK